MSKQLTKPTAVAVEHYALQGKVCMGYDPAGEPVLREMTDAELALRDATPKRHAGAPNPPKDAPSVPAVALPVKAEAKPSPGKQLPKRAEAPKKERKPGVFARAKKKLTKKDEEKAEGRAETSPGDE